MSHLEEFQQALYQEMLTHLKETDEDVPFKHGIYSYYSRTVKGKAYKIHCRKQYPAGEIETIVLDENTLAVGHDYSVVNVWKPSPSHKMLAYSIDHDGSETYAIKVIANIATQALLPDTIESTNGDIVWGNDESAFFYLTMDSEHRPDKLFLHIMGTPQSSDICLLQEPDAKFWLGIEKSADNRFVIIGSESKETSEYHVIDLLGLEGGQTHLEKVPERLQCIAKRVDGIRYDVEHQDGFFYFVTNKDGAKNSKVGHLRDLFPPLHHHRHHSGHPNPALFFLISFR